MIRDYIIQWRDAMKHIGAPFWTAHEFVLRNGQEFSGRKLPARYKRGLPKACYQNARALVLRSRGRLRYCEGFISFKWSILIHHAWAIDDADRVVDPTLANPVETDYFGIVFGPELLHTQWPKGGSMLLNAVECWDVPFMCEFDPEFQAIWQ